MTRDLHGAANRVLVERFLAGTHARDLSDLAVIDETVAERVVCHGFPGGNPHDRESYKDFFRTFRRSFDEMDLTVGALVADERHVAARWRIESTHCGAFAGVPASGLRIGFDGMVLYRIDGGRIAECWLHIDEIGLLTAIGALAPHSARCEV